MPAQDLASRQSILADQFFYFFLRLRKSRIRAVVAAVNAVILKRLPSKRPGGLLRPKRLSPFWAGPSFIFRCWFPDLAWHSGSWALWEELRSSFACTSISSWRSRSSTAWISMMRRVFPRCLRWLPPPVLQPEFRCSQVFSTSPRYFPCL